MDGLEGDLQDLKWKRYASGLFQPLAEGHDGLIYVTGRDRITRLKDLNKDGEADLYENFNNDTVVTANYHEFCLNLHTDSAGNFFYFKGAPWPPDVKSPHQALPEGFQGWLQTGGVCDRFPRAKRQRHEPGRRPDRQRQQATGCLPAKSVS